MGANLGITAAYRGFQIINIEIGGTLLACHLVHFYSVHSKWRNQCYSNISDKESKRDFYITYHNFE
jgi:hypothetical protein